MRNGGGVACCRMIEKLDETGILQALARLPQWRREGAEIVRDVKFKTYLDGAAFVGHVANIAEQMNHHPDIHLGWRKVTLRLSTHSKGGLTAMDFDLAQKIEALAP
jgi:4a-hydroxytetrahydrobiopterin dehydratase